MKWNQLQYAIRSEYGQDGVYFISDGQQEQVLKAPENPSDELFLTFLANSFGLNTPSVRVINSDCSEYRDMIEAIKPHIEESNATLIVAQEQEYQKIEPERDLELLEKRILDLGALPTFFLMEDLEGRSLRDVTQQDLEDWYGEGESLKPKGQKFLTDVGKLLVFDILTRNTDRFIFWKLPGIGEIESALGNVGNIFIRDKTKELIVIDSLIDKNVEATDYANAIKEVLARTLNTLPDNLVDRGQETLELIGYEVKANGRALILQGVREGINQLQFLNKGEALEQIKRDSLRQLSNTEGKKIDALLQFIKRVGEQITTFVVVSPMILHSKVPLVPAPLTQPTVVHLSLQTDVNGYKKQERDVQSQVKNSEISSQSPQSVTLSPKELWQQYSQRTKSSSVAQQLDVARLALAEGIPEMQIRQILQANPLLQRFGEKGAKDLVELPLRTAIAEAELSRQLHQKPQQQLSVKKKSHI